MNTAVALAELLSYRGESREEFAYGLDMLGLTPSEAWLEEPARELPDGFLERLRGAGLPCDGSTAEDAIANVIAARSDARKNKAWSESDRLRDALLPCGIALKDSKDGTTWSIAE